MKFNSNALLVAPDFSQDEYIQVTPHSAQWDHLSFVARGIKGGNKWDFETHENELGMVIPGGIVQVTSSRGRVLPLTMGLIASQIEIGVNELADETVKLRALLPT